MLTEMTERGRDQCIPYWPDKEILPSMRCGEIEIVAKSKMVYDDYQVANFILKRSHVSFIHFLSAPQNEVVIH